MKVPCYDVDINHHFQGLLENIEELKQLSGTYMTLKTENLDKIMQVYLSLFIGPIYDIPDRKHNFDALEKAVESVKKLMGPIWQINREHNYQQIIEHAESLKNLHGPCYDIDKRQHHYVAIEKHLDMAKKLMGPIYDFGNKEHKYGGRMAAGLLQKVLLI